MNWPTGERISSYNQGFVWGGGGGGGGGEGGNCPPLDILCPPLDILCPPLDILCPPPPALKVIGVKIVCLRNEITCLWLTGYIDYMNQFLAGSPLMSKLP